MRDSRVAAVVQGVQPLLQTGDDSPNALGDIIVQSLKDLLRALFAPVTDVIQTHGDPLLNLIVQTPHPDAVFTVPTNGPWPRIYGYYWETIVPLSLFLYALAIGAVILLETTSHLFGSYHRSKLKRRAFTGLLGLLSWWWIAATSLRFADALTGFLVPELSQITLFETLSFSAMGVLGLVVSLAIDFALFGLLAIVYLARQLVLYLLVLLMPILIVLWIPGVGPFALVSRFVKRLAGFYVPFLFMTLPVAVLLRIGELLGNSFALSMGGLGAWLTALVIPLIALVSPFVLIWQAGAIFFAASRTARYASTRRARDRVNRIHETSAAVGRGDQNFTRGLRGRDPVSSSAAGSAAEYSRANRAGQRLRSRIRAATETAARSGEDLPYQNDDGWSRDLDQLRDRVGRDTGRAESGQDGPDVRTRSADSERDQRDTDNGGRF
jgi:hypothetical protein